MTMINLKGAVLSCLYMIFSSNSCTEISDREDRELITTAGVGWGLHSTAVWVGDYLPQRADWGATCHSGGGLGGYLPQWEWVGGLASA